MGSQTELISIRGAQLYLIDGEESVLMQSGDFALKLLKQTHSPLAVVVANVGEVQWPVGKDAPVLKVWTRRYTFALPGLVYGMILPDRTPVSILQQLETILAQYCAFEVHHEIANAAQHYVATTGGRDVAGYWTAVAPEVETMSSKVARQICSTSTIVANSIMMGGEWAALGIKQGGSLLKRKGPDSAVSDGGVSPRMMKRMQQARRMSAVAKLMSKTLLKGAISATGHVSRSLGLDVNATATTGPIYGTAEPARNVAVASVDAFGKVVEAVETAGKSLYGITSSVGTDLVQQRFGAEAGQVVQEGLGVVGNVIHTAWTLNKMGVRMLLQVTAASTALNLRSGSKSSAASTVTASSTDDQTLSSAASTLQQQQQQDRNQRSSQQLLHQFTLSPPHHEPPPLNQLIPFESPDRSSLQQPALHTSQLFPTSAEQIRTQSAFPAQAAPPTAAVNPFMPSGNYTASFIPPDPRANSPFQQYHRHVPQPAQPPSFSFPYGSYGNMN